MSETVLAPQGNPVGKIRVALCTPMRAPNPRFVFNYGTLRNEAEYDGEIKIVPLLSIGSNLPNLRMNLAHRALQAGVDFLFWIDDDQVVPPKAIPWLIQREQDIVAVNSVTKNYPARFHAHGLDGKPLVVKPDSTGLVEASMIGFGCVMIRARVFRQIEWPWFAMPWNPKTKSCMGEDDFFSQRAREAGFKLHVDMDLSKYVGHFGDFEYNYTHGLELEASNG